MAARHFDPITVPAESGRRRVHRIQCSECPTMLDISANTWSGARAHEDLNRVFQRKGWEVGRNPSNDLCPDCRVKKRDAKRTKTESETVTAKVIPMTTAKPQEAKPASKVEQPPQPTFEDRRVIIAKLQDVYIDERVGYSSGYTDQRVARELGCPWAWVAAIREANFGPVRDNEEIRELIRDARKTLDQAKDITAKALKLQQEFTLFTRAANGLNDEIKLLDRRVTDIEKKVG